MRSLQPSSRQSSVQNVWSDSLGITWWVRKLRVAGNRSLKVGFLIMVSGAQNHNFLFADQPSNITFLGSVAILQENSRSNKSIEPMLALIFFLKSTSGLFVPVKLPQQCLKRIPLPQLQYVFRDCVNGMPNYKLKIYRQIETESTGLFKTMNACPRYCL